MAMTRFERITVNPDVMGASPAFEGCGSRFPGLLGLLAAGEDANGILSEYPYLEAEDIQAALVYAAALAEEEVVEFAR